MAPSTPTPDPQRLVVVGASIAGLRAVEAARKTGFGGTITLVGAEPHMPYTRPPLSKAYLEAPEVVPDPTLRDETSLRDELGVELVLGAAAEHLDTQAKTITVAGRDIGYDRLVIATGTTARMLHGADSVTGVHALRTLDDAMAVRAAMLEGAATVVIGCGFIGSEVASSARSRGLDVSIVESSPTPLARAIGTTMSPLITELHRRAGTALRCGVSVTRIEADHQHRVRRVHLSDGTSLPADLVVAGIGAEPATAWLTDSGLHLDNGIRCDATLSAHASGIFAAGDVANWHNELFGTHMRVEHWTTAAEQAIAATRNALTPAPKRFSTVPYFWSDWYGNRLQFVGVSGNDEVAIVSGSLDEGALLALYRTGDRLTGALTLNMPAAIMKLRAQLARRAGWDDAYDFAADLVGTARA